MFISKEKFKQIIAKAMLETARQLGKNLSISQKNAIYRSLHVKEDEITGKVRKVKF